MFLVPGRVRSGRGWCVEVLAVVVVVRLVGRLGLVGLSWRSGLRLRGPRLLRM